MSEQNFPGKRGPQYKIDEKSLEDIDEKDNKNIKKDNKKDKQVQKDISTKTQRIIYKIKPQNNNGLGSGTNNFKLINDQKVAEIQSAKNPNQDKSKQIVKQQEKKSGLKEGLFNISSLPSNGLFANLFTNNKGTQLTSKPSSGMSFGGGSAFPSIFDFASKGVPQIKASGSGGLLFGQKNEDDQSGDQAQLQNAQKLTTDPSKSSGTYVYQGNQKIILTKIAKKFKKNNNDLIEGVQVILQSDNDNKKYWLTIKLSATKNIIFNGFIIKGVSNLRNVNNKKQNIEIILVSSNKQSKQGISKDTIRLQFQSVNDAQELYQQLYKII